MHPCIHAAQPSGDFRGAKYLRRGTHPHADRAAGNGDRRAQGGRPPGQRRRRTRGNRLAGPFKDVSAAVRAHPPSQHRPGRGRRGTERPEVRRRGVPGARVHPLGRPGDDDGQRRTPPVPHGRDPSGPRLPHDELHEPERRRGRHPRLRERLLDNAVKFTDRTVKVDINTGDNYDAGIFYLTVTGLSWENGDDGSVGRGNRVSGLITPYRPMSMEAAAGKNPVTHVGKLYNLLSFEIADRIVKEHAGKVKEVWVRIVSQIGKPIDEPQAATAQIIPEKGTHLSSIVKDAEALIDEELENIYKLTDRIVQGKVRCF